MLTGEAVLGSAAAGFFQSRSSGVSSRPCGEEASFFAEVVRGGMELGSG